MHQRQAIREAVVALLTGHTAAGAHVYDTRVTPNRKPHLPALSVYTLSEKVDQDATGGTAPRLLERDLDLVIEGWVDAHAAGARISATLDALAEEVEALMDADPKLGGKVANCVLSTSEMNPEYQGESVVGLITLTYAVRYQTEAPAPPANLADFLRVKATHHLPDPAPPAVDEVTVRSP